MVEVQLNDVQQKVIDLLDAATPKSELQKWGKGYIPKHFKKLSISMDEAVALAEEGFSDAYAYFDVGFYFTQSLIYGAALSGRYHKFTIVTPSQYGKSYVLAHVSIRRAAEGNKVYVAGADSDVSEIIMGHVMSVIQTADNEIKDKLISVADKIEKLEVATSKKLLGFNGGGRIEGITLGENFNNKKSKNKAIGRGGDFIVDEASMISSDTRAEMGRSEFADKSGKKFLRLEISNPHNQGPFMDDLFSEKVDHDHLIIWMDARTALEEGNYKSKKQIIGSEFFENKSTCKRYLLCELEDYSEDSIFSEMIVDDGEIHPDTTFFLGVDSAYKGKDNVDAVLTGLDPSGTVRVLDYVVIDKSNWIDGVTSFKVIDDILRIVAKFNVKKICVDIGFGIWLVEGLTQRLGNGRVQGINFSESTTKMRKEHNHFAAVWGFNKRAEIHIDLQQLISSKDITFTSKMKETLEKQMSLVKSTIKSKGKIAIIPKDDIKLLLGKSPDELDSVLLSIHALLLHSLESSAAAIYSE